MDSDSSDKGVEITAAAAVAALNNVSTVRAAAADIVQEEASPMHKRPPGWNGEDGSSSGRPSAVTLLPEVSSSRAKGEEVVSRARWGHHHAPSVCTTGHPPINLFGKRTRLQHFQRSVCMYARDHNT